METFCRFVLQNSTMKLITCVSIVRLALVFMTALSMCRLSFQSTHHDEGEAAAVHVIQRLNSLTRIKGFRNSCWRVDGIEYCAPGVLVAGLGKSGTSALYSLLARCVDCLSQRALDSSMHCHLSLLLANVLALLPLAMVRMHHLRT